MMTYNEAIEYTRKLIAKHTPDSEAQNAIWAHACDCGFSIEDFPATGSICCSRVDDPNLYGDTGLLFKGHVLIMFKQDVASVFIRNGNPERYLEETIDESIIVDKYSMLKPSLEGEDEYTEAWIRPSECLGVYIKKSAKNFKKRYQKLIEIAGEEYVFVL